jgi:hypothetical protein
MAGILVTHLVAMSFLFFAILYEVFLAQKSDRGGSIFAVIILSFISMHVWSLYKGHEEGVQLTKLGWQQESIDILAKTKDEIDGWMDGWMDGFKRI